MLTRITLALAAVLVVAAAPIASAKSARHNAPGWTERGNTGFVPGSAAEERWFDHASSPSNL